MENRSCITQVFAAISHEHDGPPKTTHILNLPDDIMIEIFSRLPSQDVLHCRQVSRKLRNLTSSNLFIDFHRKRAVANVIIVQPGCFSQKLDYFFLSNDWKIENTQVGIRPPGNVQVPKLLSQSYDGLLLFIQRIRMPGQPGYKLLLTLHNPATQHSVRCSVPRGLIHELFRDPRSKNFCVAWGDDDSIPVCLYRILDMENCQWIGQSFYSKYVPCPEEQPLICNDSLHWTVRNSSFKASVMVLNAKINSMNDFLVIPHPEFKCIRKFHRRMHILQAGGRLSFCRISGPRGQPLIMEIWGLEGMASKSSQRIREHDVMLDVVPRARKLHVRPLLVLNGELVLALDNGREFVSVDLDTGCLVQKLCIDSSGMKNSFMRSMVIVHTSNFVPLKSSNFAPSKSSNFAPNMRDLLDRVPALY